MPKTRIGETMLQRSVVGQQQQPFAIQIEPPRRIHMLDGYEIRKRSPACDAFPFAGSLRESAQYLERFVEKKITIAQQS